MTRFLAAIVFVFVVYSFVGPGWSVVTLQSLPLTTRVLGASLMCGIGVIALRVALKKRSDPSAATALWIDHSSNRP